MEHDFWHQRWAEGRIGFHLSEVNSYLKNNWKALEICSKSTVFVPLCGKSLDLLWLREQGHSVLGNELSDTACQHFFSENEIEPESRELDGFKVRSVDGVSLYSGDFFSLVEEVVADVGAVYDRAALIALPPVMRQQYAQQMCRMLPTGVKMLLVTLEFEGNGGPPFSVRAEEVKALYSGRFNLSKLDEGLDGDRREVVWLLEDKVG